MHMSVHITFAFRYLFLLIVQNAKAFLTIGGWDGSAYWSSSVATVQNRSTFAYNVAQFAHAYNLDGIDLEYVRRYLYSTFVLNNHTC